MVDEGMVPQSLQKPLESLEKRGNPWGKMEKKRADWTKELPETCEVKVLEKGATSAETLYFVDSITSFDDRMQDIGRATAKVLNAAGEDFGILGKAEKDSGMKSDALVRKCCFRISRIRTRMRFSIPACQDRHG
jgi:Fe-S oxidoreductase